MLRTENKYKLYIHKGSFHIPKQSRSYVKKSVSLEESLIRRKLREEYYKAFLKHIEQGVFSLVELEEVDDYKGPINFVLHHGVLQPQKITPLFERLFAKGT